MTSGNTTSLVFAAGAVLLVASIVAVPGTPLVAHAPGGLVLGIGVPALWVSLALGIALLFRFAPSGKEIPWRWITWGSAFAATGRAMVLAAFSFYAAHFGQYDSTHGSLGAAMSLLS